LEIATFTIVAALVIAIVIAVVVYMQKRFHANRIHKEFLRQIKINEMHEFDHIQTLWQVAAQNVKIDHENIIGRGMQSIVYRGKRGGKRHKNLQINFDYLEIFPLFRA
jgi:uncharacterized membrane protein YraQ (UPF0718 family)